MTSSPDPQELRAALETLTTEAFRPDLSEIDRLPTLDIARLMNGEDAGVPAAVAARLPEIAAVVDAVAERMARGGRLVYAGAGTAGRLGVLDASECPPTFGTDPGQVLGVLAGGPSALVSAVEGAEDSRSWPRRTSPPCRSRPTTPWSASPPRAAPRTPWAPCGTRVRGAR